MKARDTYLTWGPAGADDHTLLCLVLGPGPEHLPTAAAAQRLLRQFGDLAGLAGANPRALTQTAGVGPAGAVRVHAALELAARARQAHADRPGPIADPEAAYAVLRPRLELLPHEELHGLYLDRRHRLLAHHRLSSGTDRHTLVDPGQVLRPAVHAGAGAFILAHNHPSGDPSPSVEDLAITERVAAAGQTLGIALLDHIVIASGGYVSLAARGRLPGFTRAAPLTC